MPVVLRVLIFLLLIAGCISCSPVVETSEQFASGAGIDEEASIAYLDKIIEHNQSNTDALYQRARLLLKKGYLLKAKEDVMGALEGEALNTDFLILKCKIDDALGQYSEAIKTLENLQKNPGFVSTVEFQLFAAELYLKNNNYNLTEYYVQRAALVVPAHVEVMYNRARLYAATTDTAKAYYFYKQVLAKDSVHENTLLHLSELFLKQSVTDSALFYLKRVRENFPLQYNVLLAKALTKKNLPDSAYTYWAKALIQSPQMAEAHYELGKYFLKKEIFTSALRHFNAVPENERKKFRPFYVLFATTFEAMGNTEEAELYFHKALVLDSLMPRPRKPKRPVLPDSLLSDSLSSEKNSPSSQVGS